MIRGTAEFLVTQSLLFSIHMLVIFQQECNMDTQYAMNLFTYFSSIPFDEKIEECVVCDRGCIEEKNLKCTTQQLLSCASYLLALQNADSRGDHCTQNLPLCIANPIDKSSVCALSFSKLLSLFWILIFTQSLFLFCPM